MFNLGFGELIFIGVVALIFIGPRQLPDVARAIAKFLNELKRAGQEASGALLSVKDEAESYLNQVVRDEPTAITEGTGHGPEAQPLSESQLPESHQAASLEPAVHGEDPKISIAKTQPGSKSTGDGEI